MAEVAPSPLDHIDPYVRGNALGWDDLRVSLTRATTGANQPSLATFRDTLQAQSFSASAVNEMFFEVQLPHSWALATEVRPHLHWSPGNSTNAGTVRWVLEYSWANVGSAFPASATLTVDQAAAGVAYSHQIASFGALSGAGMAASSLMQCRLARIGNATQDTFTGVAFALSVDLHAQFRALGGATELAGT